LLQDPEWRRPVYGVSNSQWQTNGERERLSRMLKNLQNVVNTLEPEDFVRGTDLPDPIQPTDRFQRIPHMQLVIDETPEALTVSVCRISDGFMTAPASISKPCRPVLEGLETANAAFSVLDLLKQFPEITLSDYQPLLSVLIGLGYLKYLAFKKNAVI